MTQAELMLRLQRMRIESLQAQILYYSGSVAGAPTGADSSDTSVGGYTTLVYKWTDTATGSHLLYPVQPIITMDLVSWLEVVQAAVIMAEVVELED